MSDLKDMATNTSSDLGSRIEAGSVLWVLSELAQDALAPLKKDLREIALEELNGSGTWTHQGDGSGHAKVIVPSESLNLRKNIDPLSIQGNPHWADCFEIVHKVKVRREAQGTIAKMASGDDRDQLLDQLESSQGTPRVSLKRS